MKLFCIPLICLLTSCVCRPLEVSAFADKSIVAINGEVKVTLKVKNRSNAPVIIPSVQYLERETWMSQTGITFLPDDGRYTRITRNSIVAGAKEDIIRGGEVKEYYFYWSPEQADVGKGKLHVSAPPYFNQPRPLSIKVIK